MTEVISLILSVFSIIGYIITLATFLRQSKKDAEDSARERTEMRDDIKYLRKTVDELVCMVQKTNDQTNRHEATLAQHESRLTALEHWKDIHDKKGD